MAIISHWSVILDESTIIKGGGDHVLDKWLFAIVKVIFTQMTSDLQKIIAILNILIPMRKKMLSKW